MAKRKKTTSSQLPNFSKQILSLLRKNPDEALNYKQIAARLGIVNAAERNQILKNLSQLVGKNKIDTVGRGKYKIPENTNYYEGVLDVTQQGNGYVIVEELDSDIYIPHKRLNHALHGDTVQVYLFEHAQKKKLEGEITQVIKRKTELFVGILHLHNTFGFVEMRNPKMYTDIFIPRNKVKRAKDGQVVQVKIEKWLKNTDSPEGKIIKVLGEPGSHETTIQSILAESGLANASFPKEVEAFANKIDTKIREEEIKNRKDFRDLLTFTIDPKDSKDFDDALSYQRLENGNHQVGIHIADVSHYVQPGSPMDEEALERGNSIYLVDRTIPMLPKILSNHVCSLRPQEEKYTFSAVFELNEKAEVKKQWFGKSIIKSDVRLSYAESQYLIEQQNGNIPKEIASTKENEQLTDELVQAHVVLNRLAQTLRQKRIKHGAISFDSTEVKFKLDESKNPIGIYFETQQEAHKLIEEFMLLTNRKVSEFIGKQEKQKTFIYRCHDEPDGEKLIALKNLARQFGYSIDVKDPQSITRSLNHLLNDIKGKKEENLLSTLVIRTMSKAYYSTVNIGHYGLAFTYYSHFTAPIRRYSDIVAHRLLQRYLEKGSSVSEEECEKISKRCSETERYAIEAERDSIKYMQVKYMKQFIGEHFKGVISGVTDFGLFVEIIENKCEGMVHLSELKDDHYELIEERYALVGKHTGKTYQLGDTVHVKVVRTDLTKRIIDFELSADFPK